MPVPQRQYISTTGRQPWNVDEPVSSPSYAPDAPPPEAPVRRSSAPNLGGPVGGGRAPARTAPPPPPKPTTEPTDDGANPFAEEEQDPFASTPGREEEWALAAR